MYKVILTETGDIDLEEQVSNEQWNLSDMLLFAKPLPICILFSSNSKKDCEDWKEKFLSRKLTSYELSILLKKPGFEYKLKNSDIIRSDITYLPGEEDTTCDNIEIRYWRSDWKEPTIGIIKDWGLIASLGRNFYDKSRKQN